MLAYGFGVKRTWNYIFYGTLDANSYLSNGLRGLAWWLFRTKLAASNRTNGSDERNRVWLQTELNGTEHQSLHSKTFYSLFPLKTTLNLAAQIDDVILNCQRWPPEECSSVQIKTHFPLQKGKVYVFCLSLGKISRKVMELNFSGNVNKYAANNLVTVIL